MELRLTAVGLSERVWVKLEGHNPTGSIKYRTALGLLDALDAASPLRPGMRVVESTSGNLGVALATLLRELNCEFVAVVDPKASPPVRDAMRLRGAVIHEVTDRDSQGGYLLTRLAEVRGMMERDPTLRWTDQYSNPANPYVHRHTIATEIVAQTGGLVDAVFVAVSTGGTLAGISEGVRAVVPSAAIYAVDAHGSVVTSDESGPHLLNGIGATRKSSFLRPGVFDRAVRIRDVEAFAFCRILAEDTGLVIGGSGGATLAAYTSVVAENRGTWRRPVLVIADGGVLYRSTIYNDAWLAEHDVLDRVHEIMGNVRAGQLAFELVPQEVTHV
jgi:N-(2-amino-2-carboxyethyl)-L-glutamate synthase